MSLLGASRLSAKKVLFLIPLMLLATVFSAPLVVHQAHAATGQVCLADPSANPSAPCPGSPPVFAGPVGQLIRIGIWVSGSDGFNAIDITLLGNHTWLKPFDADLTGSVLVGTTNPGAPPVVVLLCVDGRLVAGTVCSSTDSAGTLHLSAVRAAGESLTPTPTTGLLFTAIYNVTATTVAGGISVGYQTGCGSQTSVSGGVCVTTAAGTVTPTETVQGGTFDSSASATMASVVLSANPTNFGPEFVGVANTATVNATAKHGYPGSATDSVLFTVKSTPSLAVGITGTNPCITTGTLCSVSLGWTPSSAGTYAIVVSGSYSTKDSAGNPDTLVSLVTITVVVQDFSFSVSPTTVNFNAGTTGTTIVTLKSLNGFAGSVTLSGQPILAGLSVSFSLNPVVLTAGATITSTAILSDLSAAGTGHLIVKATFNGKTRSFTPALTVTVGSGADFSLTATPSIVPTMISGVVGTSTITVKPVAGFTGTVHLTNSTGSAGLVCSLSPASVVLTGQPNLNSTLSCTGSAAGSYIVQVTGSNATSHVVFVYFTVQDFTIGASPTSVTGAPGTLANSILTITGLAGFGGVVSLTVLPLSGITCSLSSSSVTGSGSSTLSCNSQGGVYSVIVNATSGSLKHTTTITFTFFVFTITASSPAPVFVDRLANSTITVTAFGVSGVTVNLSDVVTTSNVLTCTLSPAAVTGNGTSLLSCKSTTSGTSTVTVTGSSGSVSHTATVQIVVWDFIFTSSAPGPGITVYEGGTGSATMTLASDNGFAGTINLVYTVVKPHGFTLGPIPGVSLSSSSVTLAAGETKTFVVTVAVDRHVLSNIFGIEVNATSGPRTQTRAFALTVPPPGIKVVPSPALVVLGPGQTGSTTITLTSQGGLNGTVTFLPFGFSSPRALVCTLGMQSLVLTVDGSSSTVLSCSGPVGSYNVTILVTGTAPNGAQFTSLPVKAGFVVADFSVSSNPSGVLVNASVTGHASIIITWQNNYNGTVSLQLGPVSGLTASLESTTVTGSGHATVDVSSATGGTYTLVVTATSGGLSHTVSVTVTVISPQQTSTIFGLDPTLFYSLVGLVVAGVIGGVVILLRRRK